MSFWFFGGSGRAAILVVALLGPGAAGFAQADQILEVQVADTLDTGSVDVISSSTVSGVGIERVSATEALVSIADTASGMERVSGMRAGGLLSGLSVQQREDGGAVQLRLTSSEPAIFEVFAADSAVRIVFCTKGRHSRAGCPPPPPLAVPQPTLSTAASASPEVQPSAAESTALGSPSNETASQRSSVSVPESPSAGEGPASSGAQRPGEVASSSRDTRGEGDPRLDGGRAAAAPQDAGLEPSPASASAPEEDRAPAPAGSEPSSPDAGEDGVRRGVTTTRVSLRVSPSLSGRRLAVLSQGVELRIYEQSGLWLRIETADLEGWVYSAYVSLLDR